MCLFGSECLDLRVKSACVWMVTQHVRLLACERRIYVAPRLLLLGWFVLVAWVVCLRLDGLRDTHGCLLADRWFLFPFGKIMRVVNNVACTQLKLC